MKTQIKKSARSLSGARQIVNRKRKQSPLIRKSGFVPSKRFRLIFPTMNTSRSIMVPVNIWNTIILALPLGYRIPDPAFEALLRERPLRRKQRKLVLVPNKRRRRKK